MPRLPVHLFRTARDINVILPRLLPACRDLITAQNELRWLTEHVGNQKPPFDSNDPSLQPLIWKWRRRLLLQLAQQRGRGVPIQHLLGTEFFGNLELLVSKDALIPRQDTAALVIELVRRLKKGHEDAAIPQHLQVLDLCTGTGCMSFLLQHLLNDILLPSQSVHITGLDISAKALRLAERNKHRLQLDTAKSSTSLTNVDILHSPVKIRADIVISNPPYISPTAFWKNTARSVRNHEPRLALVPPMVSGSPLTQLGDTFYPHIFQAAESSEAKVLLLEISDMDQARRIVEMAPEHWVHIEIWRNGIDGQKAETEVVHISDRLITIRGPKDGHGRGVFCVSRQARTWVNLQG